MDACLRGLALNCIGLQVHLFTFMIYFKHLCLQFFMFRIQFALINFFVSLSSHYLLKVMLRSSFFVDILCIFFFLLLAI